MPIKPMSVEDALRAWSERPPESVVVVEEGRTIAVSALRLLIRALVEGLRASGSSRAAVFSQKPSILAASLLACTEARCDLLILRERPSGDDQLRSEADVDAIIQDDLSVRTAGAPRPGRRPAQGAILIPTSGTSGIPKIARHSLSGLLGRIRPGRPGSGPARWLLTYQPYGFAGLQMILTVLVTQAVLVCSSELDLAALSEAALTQRVTHISGTPTLWRSLLMCLGGSARLLPLEQATLGGEVVDQAILDKIREVFPRAAVSHIYASTEAGSLFSVRDGRAGFPAAWLAEPVDGVCLRIRAGELEVFSPRRMLGYIEGRESPLTADGWLETHDRVVRRGDRVYFLGRDDSLINVGGAKVAPEEVEAALLDVAGVLDVRAFAVPNPITGFLVGLEIVAAADGDEERITRDIVLAAGRKLEPCKIPRLIRFVNAIPRDASGKKSRKT